MLEKMGENYSREKTAPLWTDRFSVLGSTPEIQELQSDLDTIKVKYGETMNPHVVDWLENDDSEYARNFIKTLAETVDFYPEQARKDFQPKIKGMMKDMPWMIKQPYRDRIAMTGSIMPLIGMEALQKSKTPKFKAATENTGQELVAAGNDDNTFTKITKITKATKATEDTDVPFPLDEPTEKVVKRQLQDKMYDVSRNTPRNAIGDLAEVLNSEVYSGKPEDIRQMSVALLNKNSSMPTPYIAERVNDAYFFFTEDDNRKELQRLISNYPDVFEPIRDAEGGFKSREVNEVCAAIRTCEILDKKETLRRSGAEYIERSQIAYNFNRQVLASKSLAGLPEEYSGHISKRRSEGWSEVEIQQEIVEDARLREIGLEVEYKAARAFEKILIEDDKYYNVDAVFWDVFYNITNGLGASYIENQRAMAIAAEKGDAAGKSWMGETGGRLFRDYAVSTALLIATVASKGAIPAQIAEIYGGLEMIGKVRIRYNELQSMRLPHDEVVKQTAFYAFQLGLIWGGGKYTGDVIAKGTTSSVEGGKILKDISDYIIGGTMNESEALKSEVYEHK